MTAVELFTPYTVAVNLPYALAIAFVAAEVAWLARAPGPPRRAVLRSAVTAAVMGGGALAVGGGLHRPAPVGVGGARPLPAVAVRIGVGAPGACAKGRDRVILRN